MIEFRHDTQTDEDGITTDLTVFASREGLDACVSFSRTGSTVTQLVKDGVYTASRKWTWDDLDADQKQSGRSANHIINRWVRDQKSKSQATNKPTAARR